MLNNQALLDIFLERATFQHFFFKKMLEKIYHIYLVPTTTDMLLDYHGSYVTEGILTLGFHK